LIDQELLGCQIVGKGRVKRSDFVEIAIADREGNYFTHSI